MNFKKLQIKDGYNLAFNSINKNLELTLFVRRVEFSSISKVRLFLCYRSIICI